MNSVQTEKNGNSWTSLLSTYTPKFFIVLLYLVSTEFLMLWTQKFTKEWKDLDYGQEHPFFIVYTQQITYTLFLMLPLCKYCYGLVRKLPIPFYEITREDVFHAVILSGLFLGSAEFCVLGLSQTINAVDNVLFQNSSAVTFLLSIFLLNEEVNRYKIISILFSIAGAVLIIVYGVMRPEKSEENAKAKQEETLIGYVFILVSIVFYCLGCVLIGKWRAAKNNLEDTVVFLGLIGLVTSLLFWIILPMLHYSGAETFQLPPSTLNVRFFVNTFF